MYSGKEMTAMMKNGENPYRFTRHAAGLSAERLAELCGYETVNPLRNIERGKTIPDDTILRAYITHCRAPWLWYEHARHSSAIVAAHLPPMELDDLTGAYVRMNKETRDVMRTNERAEAMLCDGEIDAQEKHGAQEIARECFEAGAAHIAYGAILTA